MVAFLLAPAKEVCHNLEPNDVDDYDVLKAALLKHYELLTKLYRKMFTETQKKATENQHQFHTRVRTLLHMEDRRPQNGTRNKS